MLSKFFTAQWKYSCKDDWTQQVKTELEDFGILENLEDIKAKSKSSFKKLVKVKAKEFAFYSYCERNLYKLDSLFYTELKRQN